MDVGVVGQERLEHGPQHRLGCVLGRRDADRAGGFVPKSLSEASSAAIVSSAGPSARSSRSPASVGATRRVVRVRSRTPSRVSRRRTVWLSADCEVLSFAAARVKLCSSATTAKAFRSTSSSRCIHEG